MEKVLFSRDVTTKTIMKGGLGEIWYTHDQIKFKQIPLIESSGNLQQGPF